MALRNNRISSRNTRLADRLKAIQPEAGFSLYAA
jgi:hypothetical protein